MRWPNVWMRCKPSSMVAGGTVQDSSSGSRSPGPARGRALGREASVVTEAADRTFGFGLRVCRVAAERDLTFAAGRTGTARRFTFMAMEVLAEVAISVP